MLGVPSVKDGISNVKVAFLCIRNAKIARKNVENGSFLRVKRQNHKGMTASQYM